MGCGASQNNQQVFAFGRACTLDHGCPIIVPNSTIAIKKDNSGKTFSLSNISSASPGLSPTSSAYRSVEPGSPTNASSAARISHGCGYPVTTYVTNAEGIIVDVRTPTEWREFAMENGAESIADAPSVLGHSLFGFMTSPIKEFYSLLLSQVSSGETPVCSFRWYCDTPTSRREQLLVAERESSDRVAFHQCLLAELPQHAEFLANLRYAKSRTENDSPTGQPDSGNCVLNCGICNRFLLGREWVLPETFHLATKRYEQCESNLAMQKICPECERELVEVRSCIPSDARTETNQTADALIKAATTKMVDETKRTQTLSNSNSSPLNSATTPEDDNIACEIKVTASSRGKHGTVARPASRPDPSTIAMVIVDGDLVSARVAAHYARQAGFSPKCFSRPEAALEHMRTHTVHVLVTGGVSGIDLTKKMRSEGIGAAVVGISSSPEYEAECTVAGMVAFVHKPLCRGDFTAALRCASAVAVEAHPPAHTA
eukprot:TRINITY_DN21039_c0_g1_i1.p1 TRINITY_DN21039_c0_g1~~TRINITY_DN21039_c0_g1_i1.p1  ORF type:complete len:487 (+),score=66.38 TRINITY_DN21039_c0_g1_i1:61-1521(+)